MYKLLVAAALLCFIDLAFGQVAIDPPNRATSVVFAVFIIGFLFWLWALIDCLMKEPNTGNDKIVWLLVLLFLTVLGAIIYVAVRRPLRIRELGR